MAKKKVTRRKKAEPDSRGLTAKQAVTDAAPAAITRLAEQVEGDGGAVIGAYREPLGGQWQLLTVLPLDAVEPTPFQRDVSEAHRKRLVQRIEQIGRFLDPIIVVRSEPNQDGVRYWTPNGNHRLSALRTLGAKSVTAIVVPETSTAYKILALNTEKSHNLRERALEVIKMYQELAMLDEGGEDTYALEFEDAALITLGLCYLEQGRFSGGAYHPILRRVDSFIKKPLQAALEIRRERFKMLMDLDKKVCERVDTLKKRGLISPYLKSFVVARINPIRFRPKDAAPLSYNEVLERMTKAVDKFNTEKIKMQDLAKSGGVPEE